MSSVEVVTIEHLSVNFFAIVFRYLTPLCAIVGANIRIFSILRTNLVKYCPKAQIQCGISFTIYQKYPSDVSF